MGPEEGPERRAESMAKTDYVYMINKSNGFMTLIRFDGGKCYTFRPDVPGEWERTPVKDSIAEGNGDWTWYDDVPEEDVEYWMEKIRDVYKKAEKKG